MHYVSLVYVFHHTERSASALEHIAYLWDRVLCAVCLCVHVQPRLCAVFVGVVEFLLLFVEIVLFVVYLLS